VEVQVTAAALRSGRPTYELRSTTLRGENDETLNARSKITPDIT